MSTFFVKKCGTKIKYDIAQAEKKVLKLVDGSEELKMPLWITSVDMSFLRYKEHDWEVGKIIAEERTFVCSRVSKIQVLSE